MRSLPEALALGTLFMITLSLRESKFEGALGFGLAYFSFCGPGSIRAMLSQAEVILARFRL